MTESTTLQRRAPAPPPSKAERTEARRKERIAERERRTWRASWPLLVALYVLKALESYGYFAISISLTLFLSDEVGFDDMDAGWIYGGFGVATSVLGVLCGPLIDYMGVRGSLLIGTAVSMVGRLLIALPISPTVTLVNLFLILPLGIGLGMPVMTIAVKRYTNGSNEVYGYTLFYTVMNVSALVAGAVTDAFRHGASDSTEIFGVEFTPLRLLFLSGWVASVVMFTLALLYLKEVHVTHRGYREPFKLRRNAHLGQSVRAICRSRVFWRLMLFTAVMMFARMVFRHLDATFPKYMIREFGEKVVYGTIYSLNPLIVIIATVVIGRLTKTSVTPYNMCIIGSLFTALSVVPLLFGASYPTAITFIVILSLGEAAYSPRVYQYTMKLAPTGQEGFYTSLASAPFFVAKLFAGGLSGELLDAYCPANPPRSCETMWLIIGAMTLLSPVFLVVFRRALEAPNREMDDHPSKLAGDAWSPSDAVTESEVETLTASEAEEGASTASPTLAADADGPPASTSGVSRE